jgi:REP element-mobilizing transposase RayT
MKTENSIPRQNPPEFVTITCLEWKRVLKDDRFKDIVISSLSFLSDTKRVIIYAFVLMPNHMHFVWRIQREHRRENVHRDLLRFTSKQILSVLKNENSPLQKALTVKAKDRKYQVWERNSRKIPLYSETMIWQKINYVHLNPVRAGLCESPEDYEYSSAGFYLYGERRWDFLVHVDE